MSLPPVFTLEQLAAHLAVSVRWLREHLRQHPCGRKAGRGIVFTEEDFAKLLETLQPAGSRPAGAVFSAAPAGVMREFAKRNPPKPPVTRVGRRGPRDYMKTPRT